MKWRMLPGIMACLLAGSSLASADGWDACNKALQELRSASRRASFESLETPRKEKQLKDCLALAEKYEPFGDRCPPFKKQYQLQVAKAAAALAKVQAAIYLMELSCFYSPATGKSGPQPSVSPELQKSRWSSLKKLLAKMPLAEQLDFCKRVRFPGDCKKCLTPP